jgi:sugar phosphate isomerase/epimerase
VTGTINTIGGAFRAASVPGRRRGHRGPAAPHVALLVELHRKTGKVVTLALEPEPACRLETIGETIEFFDRHLYARGAVARVGALARLDRDRCDDAIRRHLGVCLDAGHVAVEFEEPLTALRALAFAGVPVAKIQPTAALRVREPLRPAGPAHAAGARG